MAFREVQVHEIREVLRLWLRGEGLRSAERLAGLDRKTVRRYVAAAQACGLETVLIAAFQWLASCALPPGPCHLMASDSGCFR
jgi:hypothetical protein